MYGSLPSIGIICPEVLSRKRPADIAALHRYRACTLLSAIPSSVLTEETKAPEPGMVLLLLLLQRALGHLHSSLLPSQAQETCQVQT